MVTKTIRRGWISTRSTAFLSKCFTTTPRLTIVRVKRGVAVNVYYADNAFLLACLCGAGRHPSLCYSSSSSTATWSTDTCLSIRALKEIMVSLPESPSGCSLSWMIDIKWRLLVAYNLMKRS